MRQCILRQIIQPALRQFQQVHQHDKKITEKTPTKQCKGFNPIIFNVNGQ